MQDYDNHKIDQLTSHILYCLTVMELLLILLVLFLFKYLFVCLRKLYVHNLI